MSRLRAAISLLCEVDPGYINAKRTFLSDSLSYESSVEESRIPRRMETLLMAALDWTLIRIIDKVRDDLELHAEDFVTKADLIQFVHDAIDDAEEIVIDCFSDFLLNFEYPDVTAGATEIPLPADLYESRLRGVFYSQSGFTAGIKTGDSYKLKRMRLEDAGSSNTGDAYEYRLINNSQGEQKLFVYPAITETSDSTYKPFLTWYIRKFIRPTEDSDVLDKGLRIQYILSHVKCSVMQKEGNVLLDVETGKLMKQEDKLKNSLSRLTDDDEGTLMEISDYALDEAYDTDFY